jgi:hypothetical protein
MHPNAGKRKMMNDGRVNDLAPDLKEGVVL